MKKLFSLLLIVGLVLPTVAFAGDIKEDEHNESSKLSQMTNTCLGDIISHESQVKIEDITKVDKVLSPRVANQIRDEEDIKCVIEKYNKSVFLSIIGHENNVDSTFSNNPELLDELNARSKYLVQNYGGGTTFTSYDFNLSYDDISIDENVAKAVVTRVITFQTSFDDKPYPVDADLAQKEGYVFRKINGEWKLENVIFNSEGIPNSSIDELLECNSSKQWINDFSFEKLKRNQYEDTITFTEMLNSNGEIDLDSLENPTVEYSAAYDNPSLLSDEQLRLEQSAGYSKAKCEKYAIKYGYNRNTNYRYFDADCTNFVSQAIHAGGLPKDDVHWYYRGFNDYSKSWTVVDDLRDYLMTHTLTGGYYESLPNYPSGVNEAGTLIQYSNGYQWVHSAIIRDVNANGIYVAEHTGPAGDTSYGLHGTSLAKKRTFWIGRGY